jgi:hypothetical protein
MKVKVEMQNTPDVWRLGGETAFLRIFANQSFDTSDGEFVPQSHVNSGLYLEVPCQISGYSLVIPEVELDSTEDSPTNPRATYTATLVTFRKNVIKPEFLSSFRVPSTAPNTTWPNLRLHRSPRIPLRGSCAYNSAQIEFLLAELLTYGRRSSTTQIGLARSSAPPADPDFPIHLSVTDPFWANLRDGVGLVRSGKAVLVDGRTTILSEALTPTSVINLGSMDVGVSGVLHAEVFSEVLWDGGGLHPVGFHIVSSNLGDAGQVAWMVSG